jgi:hypothetical protein
MTGAFMIAKPFAPKKGVKPFVITLEAGLLVS